MKRTGFARRLSSGRYTDGEPIVMGAANRPAGLAAGMALTMAAAMVGLFQLEEIVHGRSLSCCSEAQAHHDDRSRRVQLGPTGLYYFEGANSLRLTVEMASDRRGAYYIVYVWTPSTWVREMPEWCRYRREEILAEIKRLTSDRRIKWVEED